MDFPDFWQSGAKHVAQHSIDFKMSCTVSQQYYFFPNLIFTTIDDVPLLSHFRIFNHTKVAPNMWLCV